MILIQSYQERSKDKYILWVIDEQKQAENYRGGKCGTE